MKGPEKVAIDTRMRNDSEHYWSEEIPVTFPSLRSTYGIFYFTRPVSRRGSAICPELLPPFPAGLPTEDELKLFGVQTGPNFWSILPVVPFFNREKDGEIHLVDARKVDDASGTSVTVLFRVKQTSVSFIGKEYPPRKIERISIEPSIIAVIRDSINSTDESPVEVLKKHWVSSF